MFLFFLDLSIHSRTFWIVNGTAFFYARNIMIGEHNQAFVHIVTDFLLYATFVINHVWNHKLLFSFLNVEVAFVESAKSHPVWPLTSAHAIHFPSSVNHEMAHVDCKRKTQSSPEVDIYLCVSVQVRFPILAWYSFNFRNKKRICLGWHFYDSWKHDTQSVLHPQATMW